MALKAHSSSSNFGKRHPWRSIWEFISATKYRGCSKSCLCNKTLPHPWVFALPYVTMAHQPAPGCLRDLFKILQRPSLPSLNGLISPRIACLDQSTPHQSVKFRSLISLTQGLRRGHEKRKEKEEGRKKKTLSKQSRRLPTWSERNSVSDLHISSVRHALSRDLLHLSLTRKCVCIPNGWRRGWATARSDSEGSIRQVWLFLSSLSAAAVVRWVTQQSAVGSKCCSTAILWLVELEKVFCFFVFSGSYLSTAAITYSPYVCLCALYTCTWSSGSLSGTSGTLHTHTCTYAHVHTYTAVPI